MTTPTHDTEIEQEAERMLRELIDAFVTSDRAKCTKVRCSELFPLLRELATLRRGAEERAEIISALPDSFFSDRSLSERVLRMVREWQRVLTILQKQEDQEELAALRSLQEKTK